MNKALLLFMVFTQVFLLGGLVIFHIGPQIFALIGDVCINDSFRSFIKVAQVVNLGVQVIMAIFVLFILKKITLLDPAKSESQVYDENMPTFSQCDTFIDKVDIEGLNETLQDGEATADFVNSPPES